MFYFFFESRSKPKDDPVILWMTGQLGYRAGDCQSSMAGARISCKCSQHAKLLLHEKLQLDLCTAPLHPVRASC